MKQVELSGTIQLPAGQTCDPPIMTLGFVQHGWTPSGLKVTQLLLSRETYKPFKGIRYIAQGGNITIRTWKIEITKKWERINKIILFIVIVIISYILLAFLHKLVATDFAWENQWSVSHPIRHRISRLCLYVCVQRNIYDMQRNQKQPSKLTSNDNPDLLIHIRYEFRSH